MSTSINTTDPPPPGMTIPPKVIKDALTIRNVYISSALHNILSLEENTHLAGTKIFLEDFLARAGKPSDPIECIMIEQMVLAHYRLALLHARAAAAKDTKRIEVFNTAVVRLLGELRRMALALRDYRTPTQGRSTTVVHRVEQWNQAQGDQDVDYARADGSEGGSQKKCRDTKLTSNDNRSEHDDLHKKREQRLKESASGCSRSLEPVKT